MKHSPLHQRRTRDEPCPICLDRFIRRHYHFDPNLVRRIDYPLTMEHVQRIFEESGLYLNQEVVFGGRADRLLDLLDVLQILSLTALKVTTSTETKEFLDGYCVPRETYIVKGQPRRNRWRHWVTPTKNDIYVRAGDLVEPIAEAVKFERSLQARSGS